MADEAFALSPITARAAQPSEEDYDAISQAFMETSRGRWFLGEYARRNRNADTRMVLDAVSRIEESLAAQRQPAAESGLADALAAIRRAVDEAQADASAALDSLALEENLAPVRRGARVLREIAWRWREIGADGRMCDLLDAQVSAIEAGCEKISSDGPRGVLSAAFDLIRERIAGFGDDGAAAPHAAEAAPSPAPSIEIAAAAVEIAHETSATDDIEATDKAEAADVTAAGAEAYDEAVLDLIALEMAAPDPSDYDEPSLTSHEIHVTESGPADPIIVAEKPAPAVAPAQPSAIQTSMLPSNQSSLGSTLIANGIVRRSNAMGTDPLAPIRRMSQAEKIAFFS